MTQLTFDGTDLDSAASETGVVHESTTNTDHTDANTIKQGYPYGSFDVISPTPVACWPLHEDSGTTANDLAGTNDGTYNGPTLGQTGPLGTTAPSFDGTNDLISLPSLSTPSAYTICGWAYGETLTDGTTRNAIFLQDLGCRIRTGGGGSIQFLAWDGSSYNTETFAISENEWYFFALTNDGSTATGYVNGSAETSASVSGTASDGSANSIGGDDADDRHYWDGPLADWRLYDTELSWSQVQALHDVVATAGEHITTAKVS